MPGGSSSKGKQAAGAWAWTNKRNWDLSKDSQKTEDLKKGFAHKDFRLSRAWLCFAGENANGTVRTNHASLKFDFKPSDNHPWKGVKLEAQERQDISPDQVRQKGYTDSRVILGLKDYDKAPEGMRLCVEIETRFDSVHGGTTLGDFIRILSENKLLRFGFLTKKSFFGPGRKDYVEVYVGCRDYVAQVLFAVENAGRIKKSPVKDTVGRRVEVNQYGESSKPPKFSDIHAALAVYCEQMEAFDKQVYTITSTSAVDKGYFPDWIDIGKQRTETANGYPYAVRYPHGTRSDKVVSRPVTDKGGSAGQGGGYGGQGGGYGGYGYPPGPSMPGPSNYYYSG